MKRLLFKMLTLAAVLTTLQASAAMYIVGNEPFGNWNLENPAQMTDNGDGIYTYTTDINGLVYFVFADGITNDWTEFNNNYRYGPGESGPSVIADGSWVSVQKGGTDTYFFTGGGGQYTITFDTNNMCFKFERKGIYDFMSEGFCYNFTGYNTVELTKTQRYSSSYSGDVTIPSSVTYDGMTYQVTGIGASAFMSCHDLTSVTIPTTVTTIGESAFYYCESLTKVVIPESVRTIDDWNFYVSPELTTVVLPSTLRSMGSECFGSCPKLSKVTCKATPPPSIGSYCFSAVYSVSPTLYVPEEAVSDYQANSDWSYNFGSVEAMPDYDFEYLNLQFAITGPNTVKVVRPCIDPQGASWSIPDTAPYEGVDYRVTEVGNEAFYFCQHLTAMTLGSNVEVVDAYAFYGCYALTSLNLGNVQEIDDCAFGDCEALTSVTIPSSVTSIGVYGFGGCGLTSVSIPATLEYIAERAFYNCQSLTAINVDSNNPNYTAVDGVLFNKDMTTLHSYPASKDLESYIVPESVTVISDGAFGASSLESVTLPTGLNRVGYLAFTYNNSMTRIICLAQTPPSVGSYAFSGTTENSGLTLYVPRGCKSAYEAAEGWQEFPNIQEKYYDFDWNGLYYNITGESTVEVTNDNENGGTYLASSITIPESVTYNGKTYTVTAIGTDAFKNCNGLGKVTLPSTVTEIGWGAFYCCYYLTKINLPENLTTIETYAFYECARLGNVVIPASVTWLGTYAFCGCHSMTEVIIPDNVTMIGYGAFYGCNSLTTVTIGSSVFSMENMVFYDCTELTKIICLATTPPYIESGTFTAGHYSNATLLVPKGCLSAYQNADYWRNFTNITEMSFDFEKDGIFYNILNSGAVEVTYMTSDYNSYRGVVNIPETVTHNGVTYTVTAIGNNAFRMSKSLTAVTIPNTVTTIGSYAFYYCEGLTNVTLPNSLTTIGNNAFWLCLNLSEVVIPNSVTTIGSMAFRNCTAMTRVVIGENVASIGSTCFIYNPNITEVICLATIPPTLYDPASGSMTTFQTSVYTNAVLRVPYGSHEAYREDPNWSRFVNIVSEEIVNPVMTGDVNGDGRISIKDVTDLINYLLSGDASGINLVAADINGDGQIKISDVTALINMLLSGDGGEAVGSARADYLINSVPFTMIKVDGGTFMMGGEGIYDATPVHQVTLSDYYIGQTEVTQALWQTVMGSNPSSNKSDVNLPVENMTWDECQTFATKLSQLTGKGFRLPTEAEWEFAARGGNDSQGYTYAGSNDLNEVGWYSGNSGGKTHVVGTKAPNELGLYDMSGNVFEWIQDYFASYTSEPQVDPQGPTSGQYRVCRSSAYNRANNNDWFKCAGRTYDSPSTNAYDTGLRVAFTR